MEHGERGRTVGSRGRAARPIDTTTRDAHDVLALPMHSRSAMNALRNTLLAALLLAPLSACGGPSGLPRFNEATIETVSGWVIAVDPYTRLERNTRNGVKATVRTYDDEQEVEVYLGPATYMDHYGVVINKGDEVEVVGSKVRHDGDDVIIATVLHEDGHRLQLREPDGRPAWRTFKRDRD